MMYTIGIEAGNSRIKLGLFKNGKLKEIYTFPRKGSLIPDIPAGWKKIKPQLIGMASVVPSLNSAIKSKFRDSFGKRVMLINHKNCGIPLKIKNPEKAGIDRMLNCKAAIRIFGSPVIVVDIGTALTVDIASEKEGFLGGAILPGAELWVNSLKNTAMIKDIRPAGVKFPGRDTNEAVFGGLKYGMEGAVNNILDISFRRRPSAVLVLTGGGSGILKNRIRHGKKVRRHLTMEGIGMVLQETADKF
ncbi:MAG: type III pantothenate kinase [Candidatus Omnitrophica bacterium]|nr:type III pantothenate kinase [Candidatus Omnitrophota bacterium]